MTEKRAAFDGRHVVITGGSSGLGLELAGRCRQLGARVTLVARDAEKLARAQQQVGAGTAGTAVATLAVDVADGAALSDAFAEVASTAPIDVLVNSAGILREGHFADLTDDDFRAVMDVNFFGTVNAVRAALPHLPRPGGRIVNISSVAGLMGVFGYTSYSASKHALVGFTDSLRYEMDAHGIAVNLVCPGEFDSPMVDSLDTTRTPQNREHTLTIPKLSAAQIADEVVAGIGRDVPVIIPGRRTRTAVRGQRLAPGIARAVGRRRVAGATRAGGDR